jgi:hypothetical protein
MTQPKLVSFPEEDIKYLTPSWGQMNQLAFDISKNIELDGNEFDRIVTLAKGGWPMTRSLVDFLQIDEVASIGVKFYKGVDERYEHPRIYQDIPVSIQGETVLLFDDVADTGESLEFTINYLKTRGAAKIKTATLYYKPHSKITPDYYGQKTDSWIVFPYDVVEMIETFSKKWTEAGLSEQEILDRFAQLKFKQYWSRYYLEKFLNQE